MIKVLLSTAVALAVLSGCTSDSNNPSTIVAFVSSKVGTYILSSNTVLEKSSTGADSATVTFTDSTTFRGSATVEDSKGISKSSGQYVSMQSGVAYDTLYLSEDGAKLYRLFDIGFNIPGLGNVELGTRWIQIADQQQSSWTGLQDTIRGINISYSGLPLTIDAVFTVKGSRGGSDNLSINGSTVSANRFSLDYQIALEISNPILGSIPVDPIKLPMDIWLVKGVGLVKVYQKPSTVKIGPPANQEINIPGFLMEATQYVIAP